jgi:hypothetical protein
VLCFLACCHVLLHDAASALQQAALGAVVLQS